MKVQSEIPRIALRVSGAAPRLSVSSPSARLQVRAQPVPVALQVKAPAVAVTVAQPALSMGVAGVQGPPGQDGALTEDVDLGTFN